jgi:hypothetical protein
VSPYLKLTTSSIPLGGQAVKHRQDPLHEIQPALTTPAFEPEKSIDAAVLEEPSCKILHPAPVVTSEISINEGAEQSGGDELVVADQAAKSSAPK